LSCSFDPRQALVDRVGVFLYIVEVRTNLVDVGADVVDPLENAAAWMRMAKTKRMSVTPACLSGKNVVPDLVPDSHDPT
jgi:hypothetical protein